jgi:hypothetical protein
LDFKTGYKIKYRHKHKEPNYPLMPWHEIYSRIVVATIVLTEHGCKLNYSLFKRHHYRLATACCLLVKNLALHHLFTNVKINTDYTKSDYV